MTFPTGESFTWSTSAGITAAGDSDATPITCASGAYVGASIPVHSAAAPPCEWPHTGITPDARHDPEETAGEKADPDEDREPTDREARPDGDRDPERDPAAAAPAGERVRRRGDLTRTDEDEADRDESDEDAERRERLERDRDPDADRGEAKQERAPPRQAPEEPAVEPS